MWENVISIPRGRISTRRFMFLAVTFLVTIFGYSFVASTPAFAADAEWSGNSIVYNDQTYAGPNSTASGDGLNLPPDTKYYLYVEPAAPNVVTRKAHIIYFTPGLDPPMATEATAADYDQVNGTFSNKSNEESITLTPHPETQPPDSTCTPQGVGWIVCPLSRWIAEGVDYLYGIIESFLTVAPLSTTNTTGNAYGIYQMWKVMLNIANVGFIIGFLILIYGQITGGAVSNYTIKKLLPRVIVAAVLVNISYWICALAVDISNVLGVSVQQLFMSMFDQLGPSNSNASDIDFSSINWSTVTAAALSGTAVIGGLAFLSGGVGVSAGALALTIVVALIPVLFAVFVAVAILAARQALITIFIIISPLAFMAYLLPNTEEWFKRWRKLFISMLIMFPAFAVVFGGAQLAGRVIIQTAETMPIVILGLVVQVVPLFITPFLIKLSSGILGTIAGLSNDKSKGVFDWAKNDLSARRDAARSKAQAKGLKRLDKSKWANSDSRFKRGVRRTRSGAYLSTGDKRRDARKSMYDNAIGGYSEYYAGQGRKGFQAYNLSKSGGLAKDAMEHTNQKLFEQKMSRLEEDRTTPKTALGRRLQANEDKAYDRLRHLEHESHESHARADALEKGREERGKDAMMSAIALAEDGTYDARFRDYMAETQKHTRKATSATAKIQHMGDTLFDEGVYTDPSIRKLRIHEGAAEDRMKTAKAAQEKLFTEMRVDGSSVLGEGESIQLRNLADAMQKESVKQKIIADAVQNAEIKDKDKYTKIVRGDKTLEELGLASESLNWAEASQTVTEVGGGIVGVTGSRRMLARARADRSARLAENIKNARSPLSEMTLDNLLHLVQKGEYVNEKGVKVKADEEEIFAAEYEIMEKKGNHEAVLSLWNKNAREHGMMVDKDTGRHFLPKRNEVTGMVERDANDKPIVKEWLDAEQVENHADAQQIWLDAYNNSARKIKMFSGTERGMWAAGMGAKTMREAMIEEVSKGKVEVNDIREANIDEFDDWIRAFRDPSFREKLTPSAKQKFLESIEEAQHLGGLEPRIFDAMSMVANYLEVPDDDNTRYDGENHPIEKEIKFITKTDKTTGRKIKVRVPRSSSGTLIIDGESLEVETMHGEIRDVQDHRKFGVDSPRIAEDET